MYRDMSVAQNWKKRFFCFCFVFVSYNSTQLISFDKLALSNEQKKKVLNIKFKLKLKFITKQSLFCKFF